MKRDKNVLVRQLKVKNSIANHFSYFASLRILLSITQKGGRRKKTAKRLCMRNMTGLYLTDLTSFAVISTEHYCVMVCKERSV